MIIKTLIRTIASLAFLLSLVPLNLRAQQNVWATAYYAGWQQGYNNTGAMPAEAVDMSAVTHIIHFSLVPRSDGTLDDAANSVTAFNADKVVTRAHAAGKKVIICVGGWATDVAFRGATSSANRSTFISNLVNLMTSRGYDGIDVDWERLESGDAALFTTFIRELRDALDQVSPRPLLTIATAWQPSIVAQVHQELDQVNLMTYDLAGAWPGWVTWHNAAIYDGGYRFPSTGGAVPTIDGMVNSFTAAGIPSGKIGIGIDFYGYIWNGGSGTPAGGATEPRQSWSTAPSVQANVSYATIMKNYYQSQYYRFDNAAQVSYLSIDQAGSASDKFISYDDEVTVAKKVDYARQKGIGGVIVWELGGGYRSDLPAGQRDPLLQSLKSALLGGLPADGTPPVISFAAPAANAVLSLIVPVTVNATDNVGVTGVQFMLDGSPLGSEDPSAPFSISWNTGLIGNGQHTLSAAARDAAGNTSTASVTISVLNLLQDNTPPTVSLTAPSNGSAVSGSVTLSATASDNVSVSGVTFMVDGVNVGSEDVSSPYTDSWSSGSVANGSHTVAAVARDAAGNQAVSSVTVSVSNSNPPTANPTFSVVASDGFNRANQRPVAGSQWIQLLNQPSGGTMEVFQNVLQPYSAAGTGNAGGIAWGTMLPNGNGISLKVARKSGTNVNSTLFMYLRMNSRDLATGDGYRLRYLENPSGTDVLAIQRVTNGTTGVDIASTSREVNVGDVLTFYAQDDAVATMEIYVNGDKVVSAVDNAYNPSTWYAWVRAFVLPTNPQFDDFAVVSASSGQPQVPSAPALVSPSNGATAVAVPVTFTWNAVPGAETYNLQVSATSSFSSFIENQTGLTSTTNASGSLPAGTTLFWRVGASNGAGQGSWSPAFSFATKAAQDTSRPVITVDSPAPNATVSGTVTLKATASDNIGVVGVKFLVDGVESGAEGTTAPYDFSWDSKTVTDGQHVLTVSARDAAGNSSTASVSVTVSNSVASPTYVGIVTDGLVSPWVNTSWGASVEFASQEKVLNGASAIRVDQRAWGSVSVHSGSWGSAVPVSTAGYSALEVSLHGGPSGIRVAVLFENDKRETFQRVSLGTIPAGTWKTFAIPMSSLNPSGRIVHRIDILEESGSSRLYYVDDLRFVNASQGPQAASTPVEDETTESVAGAFALGQNYPNPFNPSTTISFTMQTDAHVTVEVYNVVGQLVSVLADGLRSAGLHSVQFDASHLPSGMYFCRMKAVSLETGSELINVTRRMMFTK